MLKFNTKDEVVQHAQALIGKTIRQFHSDHPDLEKNHKGGFGHLLEAVHYGYEINSRSEADFKELGIELKGAPLKELKNGRLRAKERIVLGLIDFMAIVHQNFYTSDFWRKNENLLIVFYIHSAKKPADRLIALADLWSYPAADLIIIEGDWQFIKDKVRAGKAHELSEGDTMYLGACTKGADSKVLRKQPYSNEKAKQRAFSLKGNYVNIIIESFQKERHAGKQLLKEGDLRLLEKQSFESLILQRFSTYRGRSVMEIAGLLGETINWKAKSAYSTLVARMLNAPSTRGIEEFEKAGITIRTLRINKKGMPKEDISFPAFKYKDLISTDWEDSALFEQLDSRKILFVVFLMPDEVNGPICFSHAKFWNMPAGEIDKARHTWERTKSIVQSGAIVNRVKPNGTNATNFPHSSETEIIHVRPHGRDKHDTYELPVPDRVTGFDAYTKHSFWLNKKYVAQAIRE